MDNMIMLVPCGDIDEGRQRAISHIGNRPFSVISSCSELGNTSLFGNDITLMVTSDKNEIEGLTHIDFDEYKGDGLVIVTTCQTNLRDMKTLSSMVKRVGGIVLHRKEEAGTIIDSMPLRSEVKSLLHAYTMDEYSQNASIIDELSKLDEQSQRSMSIDDILARLPQKPGSIPPWGNGWGRNKVEGLDELIIRGDTNGALVKAQRIIDGGTPPIMTIAWLKNQWRVSLEMCILSHAGYEDTKIARILSLPNPQYRKSGQKDPETGKSGYPTYIRIRSSRNMDTNAMLSSMKIINDTDKALKGGDRRMMLSPNNLMIRMVTLLCN
jgi:hypothetical protein